MQSNDYHLDRALYQACREDRERFCSSVVGGNGRVYRCLYEQKFNNMMSSAVSGKLIKYFFSLRFFVVLVSRRNRSTTEISGCQCTA